MLDPFQKESLRCIENMQSVLVSAHTSAGKTVVAEYAIAMSLRDTQRVIYTTPIKVGIIWKAIFIALISTECYLRTKLPIRCLGLFEYFTLSLNWNGD